MVEAVAPETPNLAERFIGLTRLPHAVGCVVVALLFLIFGAFMLYLQTFDLALFRAQFQPIAAIPAALFAYMFYAPHYMRRKVVQAEASLSPLLANRERDFHALFGRISARRPQLVVWMGLLAFFLATTWSQALLSGRITAAAIINDLAFIAYASLGIGVTAWTYFSAMKATRNLGGYPLQLVGFYRDRFLGLRAVGSLTLSLTATYFAFAALFVVATTVGQPPGIIVYAFISELIVLGLLLFFLPLTRLHQRMLLQKQTEQEKLNRQFSHLFENPSEDKPASDATQTLILDTLRWDVMKSEIGAIATWPFDTQILSRLIVIVLTVTAILVAQAIRTTLGLF